MKKPKPLDQEGLMNYAAMALSARAQSLNELRNRLKLRAARQEDVAEVLSRLKQAGLIDDTRFAGSFANWRRENQGFGKARVVRDLMARRVAPHPTTLSTPTRRRSWARSSSSVRRS